MTTQPAAHFQATNTALIRLAVEAFATAPHFTAAEQKNRSEAVICGIMAFLPSEPVQTMLASQAVGQHLLALDTIREVFNRSLTENASIRMRAAAAMCTRSTLALVREIRVVRAGHLAAALADQVAHTDGDAAPAELDHLAANSPAEAAPVEQPPAATSASPEPVAETVPDRATTGPDAASTGGVAAPELAGNSGFQAPEVRTSAAPGSEPDGMASPGSPHPELASPGVGGAGAGTAPTPGSLRSDAALLAAWLAEPRVIA
jgi:hypothetical protein